MTNHHYTFQTTLNEQKAQWLQKQYQMRLSKGLVSHFDTCTITVLMQTSSHLKVLD